MSTLSALQLARQYVDSVKDSGIEVEKAYLFGSYAKKTNHKWSDIDVCIISPSFNNRFEDRVKLLHVRTLDQLDIEPHPLNSDELGSPYNTLAHEVLKYGIPLI